MIKYKNDFQGILLDTHEMLIQIYKQSEEKNATNSVLSTHETEVLYWSSIGKTYAEVAEILHFTVSTVKFHMGNTVRKLGVKNAKHAISLANELNLIPRPGK
ncbi:response regulator transcription factor [Pantoea sp. App145]|uniref:response regulator transcription factor n=1 Tax=Pantoea sp. App145 TaxID=3071567 RepID=UPI003A7F7CD3